ncbi:thiazolylpeptide-type bacteriocin [Actinomyces oris]|uniref:Thiazolylpeptide-type bacteriocin n=1 Tax=Actinomyces oris TaxID=544580 RepID=A0A1Q8VKR0_9ACTO|nr:thiazolylpeptide-type bacteriocin [Actinomyces oris]
MSDSTIIDGLEFQDLSDAFAGIEVLELDETMTLSETAASSGISSCNSCSCCLSTSCCSVHIGA